ncbi:hypothetical protein TP70_11300 [Staphylococcus microti]|uniref:Nuclease SbcCD subunit C n=1 Tax=Staphylococcus microti TaxID=569857 RepID=A0A0D6XLP0_9STAP|nr:exonuclease subunit SbcC [Staphylococcus microti]KIX89739.1 hypothetical protein TP70_11300 [Staphylococcus microti]PNZ83484.1 SMC family ATPase [Staphylococcus microti]SUM57711.1 exonuclease SbcC [Staphylococcus microti]
MKPILLRLENFGPFVDETIDFSKIQENQLFLISGKTGSGKTMIFDGIVFALYGRASTKGRKVEDLRNQFANPKLPLKVTFEFEVRGQRYKVIRTAAYRKPGNKSDTNPTLEVYVYDTHQYVLKESKRTEGNQYLLDLIRLKEDQFRQLFILPQGEFKRFLISKTSDKQVILRTLFNTQLYDVLNHQLQDKTKDIKHDIEKQQERIEDRWQDLATFDNEVLQAYQTYASQQHDRLLEVLPKYREIGQEVVRNLENTTTQMSAKVEKVRAEIEQQNQRVDLEKKLNDVNHHIETLEAEKTKIRVLEERLKRITDSKLAVKLYQDLTNEKVQLSHYEKQIDEQKDMLQVAQQSLELLKAEQTDLEAKNETITAQRTFVNNTLYYYQNATVYQTHQANRTQNIKALETLNTQLETYQKQYQDLKASLNGEVVDIDKERMYLDQLQEATQAFDELKQAQKEAMQAEQLKEKIAKATAEIESLEAKITLKQQQVQHLSHNDQALLNHEEAVHMLRSELKTDEPCPVCRQIVRHAVEGTTIEALKSQQQQNDLLAQEIQQMREKVNAEQGSLHYLKSDYEKVAHVQFDVAQFETQQQNIASLTKAYETLRDSNKKLEKSSKRLADIEQSINQVKQEIALKTQQLARDIDAVETFEKDTGYDDIQAFVKAHKAQVKQIDDYEKVVDAQRIKIQKCEKKIYEHTSQLDRTQMMLEKTLNDVQKLTTELDDELGHLKLKDVQALKQVADEVHLEDEIKAEIKRHSDDYQVAVAKQKELKQSLASIEVVDIEILNTTFKALKTDYDQQLKQYNQTEAQLKANEVRIQEIETHIQYLKDQLSAQSELVELSEIIKGNNHRKLSLENYVLTYYLDQILIQANKRLLNMTGDRYQLVRGEKAGKGFSGLEIEVFDYYANQSRPITSLSGGETFQASLALALGLCEIVQNEQGGISLDAMFIDEGFGTLDQETLETALDTLIQLQSSGRLVGVISHVTELKERIPVILEVISNNYQSHTRLTIRE